MRAQRVVFLDPAGDHDPCLERAVEVLAVEDLVAHRAVEALHVGVLLRGAPLDKMGSTPRPASHSRVDSAMNSLPLSERMNRGLPCFLKSHPSSWVTSRAPR